MSDNSITILNNQYNIDNNYNPINTYFDVTNEVTNLYNHFSNKFVNKISKNYSNILLVKRGAFFKKMHPFSLHFSPFSNSLPIGLTNRLVGERHTGIYNNPSSHFPLLPPLKGRISVGVDCEWVNVDESRNNILLTQFYFYELEVGFIIIHKDNKRFGLDDFMTLLLPYISSYVCEGIKYSTLHIQFVAHYGLAEFSHFKNRFKTKMINNTVVVRGVPVTVKASDKLAIKVNKPSNAHKIKIRCSYHDTYLLFNSSLADIGNNLGIPKLELSDYEISHFDEFMNTNIIKALDYAINDAIITAIAFNKLLLLISKLTGQHLSTIPITASSIGVLLLKAKVPNWRDIAMSTAITLYDFENDKTITQNAINVEMEACMPTYHGGVNMVYNVGKFIGDDTYDYDIISAYPTALCSTRNTDFSHTFQLRLDNNNHIVDISELSYNSLGRVKLDFKFKPGVMPLIPYSTTNGLIFCIKGKEYTITPLLFYYCIINDLFESYYIHESSIFKTNNDDSLAIFINELIKARQQSTSPFERALLKLIVNGFYGKMGQGIKTDLPLSPISNPPLAAYVTETVRLLVLEHTQYLIKQGYLVYSITTDGYMIKGAISEKDRRAINTLPLTAYVLSQNNSKDILSLKHHQKPNSDNVTVVYRTRGYYMQNGNDDEHLLIAKNGVKLPKELKNSSNDSKISYLVDVIENKKGLNIQHIPKRKDFILNPNKFEDMTTVTVEKRIGFGPDYKGRMIYKGFQNGMARYTYSPYNDIKEALTTINNVANFKKILNNRNDATYNANNYFLNQKWCEELEYYLEFCEKYPEIRYMDGYLDRLLINAIITKYPNYSNKEISNLTGYDTDKIKYMKYDIKREKSKAINITFDKNFILKYSNLLGSKYTDLCLKYLCYN